MADATADPGCKQKIAKVVQVVGTPATVACNDLINIPLDSSCMAVVFPDMVPEGTYYCFDDYTVVLNYPAGTTQFTPPNKVDGTHINKVVTYILVHTIIGFHLPEVTEATLNVYGETGRLLFNQTGDFAKSHNAFTLDKALVNTTGVLYYQVSTSEHSATMKMIHETGPKCEV